MAAPYCVVLTTVGKREEADRIASAVVEARLAACCNVFPGISSLYHWKGRVCRDEEVLLLFKTRADLFEELRRKIAELHSYEVPEIIAVPVSEGHAPYLEWIRTETRP